MRRLDRLRVLLIWPGGLAGGGANFGVPQMLGLARALESQTDAIVDVMDLDMERAFGPVDIQRLVGSRYDLVGISCYSSFDYLKVIAIAELVRRANPRAWIVAGGYHPSARPSDFTFDGSPVDFAVIGDGERPLVRLASDLIRGIRPLNRILGPESVQNPDDLVTYRWELLERYRPIARRLASQAVPVLESGEQRLTLIVKNESGVVRSTFGSVHFVLDRHPTAGPAFATQS